MSEAKEDPTMIRNTPRGAAITGVDLGKNVFHVVGLDDRGETF
jgi:transposase